MLLIDAVICMWCIDDKTSVVGGGVRMMWGVCCVFVIIIIVIFCKKKKKKKNILEIIWCTVRNAESVSIGGCWCEYGILWREMSVDWFCLWCCFAFCFCHWGIVIIIIIFCILTWLSAVCLRIRRDFDLMQETGALGGRKNARRNVHQNLLVLLLLQRYYDDYYCAPKAQALYYALHWVKETLVARNAQKCCSFWRKDEENCL